MSIQERVDRPDEPQRLTLGQDVNEAPSSCSPPSPPRQSSPSHDTKNYLLFTALVEGDAPKAKGLVLSRADVNALRDDRGYSALHLAVLRGIPGLTRLLLQNSAQVTDTGGRSNRTPLQLAYSISDSMQQRILIQARANPVVELSKAEMDPLKFFDYGGAPFKDNALIAASNADEIVRRKCTCCSKAPKQPLKGASTITLLDAIWRGDLYAAQGQVMAGVAVDSARDKNGLAAIHLAASRGSVGLTRLLLDNAANPDTLTIFERWTALHFAAQKGHSIVVQLLLERRSKVNIASAMGETPLSLTACDGNTYIVKMLLDAKAEPDLPVLKTSSRPLSAHDVRSKSKSTTILRAMRNNADTDVVAQLVLAGASLERDIESNPLLLAVQQGNVRTARLLLEHRAEPRGVGGHGDLASALHLAARNGQSRLVTMLVRGRADVNARDTHGRLAIDEAYGRGIKRQLLKLGSLKESEFSGPDIIASASALPQSFAVVRSTPKIYPSTWRPASCPGRATRSLAGRAGASPPKAFRIANGTFAVPYALAGTCRC